MKKLFRPLGLLLLAILVAGALSGGGCCSEGSREYLPGEGWKQT